MTARALRGMILNKMRRITRDGRYIPEIDGLRFLAIVSVLLFHIAAELELRSGSPLPIQERYLPLKHVLDRGDRGVALFFVISGMILALPFARHTLAAGRQVSLRKYYLRRVTRLEPPYVVAILIIVGLILIYQRGHPAPEFWPHALATLLYLHGALYGRMSDVSPVTWSLEVEVQFYLLAPLFMLLFRIRGKAVRRGLMLLAVFATSLAVAPFLETSAVMFSIFAHLQFFLAGLFLADLFILDLAGMSQSAWWDLAALLALGSIFAITEAWWTRSVLPFLFILLVLAGMRSVLFQKVIAYPWIAAIGGMCYSIYLLHFAVIAIVFKVTRRLMLARFDFLATFLIQAFLLGIPVFLVSTAFFLAVERPCMDPNWPRRLYSKITGKVAPTALAE